MSTRAEKMLTDLENISDLGRQKCFELGNPYYYKDVIDRSEPGNQSRNYWRKELPTGEIFLVTLEITEAENNAYSIKDTVIRRLK